jgi:N-succinyldiaminopimelate aminotransferase
MPRFPHLDPNSDNLGGSVFSSLAPRIARLEGEVYPLHIGDTWLNPGPTFDYPVLDSVKFQPPQHHRYADPHGDRELLGMLATKARHENGLDAAGPENVLMTAGATGALTAAAMTTLSPGDEALILAPYWPLIRGIVVNSRAIPVEVPVLHETPDAATLASELESRITDRTAAIYLNTPSNPTGKLLDRGQLGAIAEVAKRHGLWLFSDEVYEDYAFSDQHISIGSLAPERTLSVFSFSKAFGMAGHRCGYLIGPKNTISRARRVVTYVWYSVPTPGQFLAREALSSGRPWIEKARTEYRAAGNRSADRLGLAAPEGGTFLFMDVASSLDERGLLGFLEDCLDDNLILAPGTSFGADYSTWVRLCFTCVAPDIVARGVERLARRLGR